MKKIPKINRKQRAERDARIVEDFQSGMPIKDICSKYGVTGQTVGLKVRGLERSQAVKDRWAREAKEAKAKLSASLTHSEEWAAQYIKDRTGGRLVYIGGYVSMDDPVYVMCADCGCVYKQPMVSFRQNAVASRMLCPNCRTILKAAKEKAIAEQRDANRIQREALISERRFARLRTKEQSFVFRVCAVCGKRFKTTRASLRVCCSSECSKKRNNSQHTRKQDVRLGKPRKSLKRWQDIFDITGDLHCAICGELCDVTDIETRADGTKIAGNRYPSIDHIVPVSKGGTDDMENVQIVHRICNVYKSDKSLYRIVAGRAR